MNPIEDKLRGARQYFRVAGLLLLVSIVGFLGYAFAYVPLKFSYLVRQVELARTADEEKQAFKLATIWGRVWKVYRIRPEDWLVRLEWLETSPFNGAAYDAYRTIADTNNLRILQDKEYSTAQR